MYPEWVIASWDALVFLSAIFISWLALHGPFPCKISDFKAEILIINLSCSCLVGYVWIPTCFVTFSELFLGETVSDTFFIIPVIFLCRSANDNLSFQSK